MQNRFKYIEIKKSILRLVDEGKYASTPLPGRREMAESFHTTIATCTKAVQELITEGVLKTIPGKGTFQHPDYGKRLRTLNVWIPGMNHTFHIKIAEILTDLAQEYGYSQVTVTLNRTFPQSELRILSNQLSDPNSDVLLYSLCDARSLPVILRHHERVVLLRAGDVELNGNIDRAVIRRFAGEKLSVEHLIKNGHTRIVHICTAAATPDFNSDGYRQALQEHNIPFNRKLRFMLDRWDTSSREEQSMFIDDCMQRFLRFKDRPTAVFCHSNELAIMFISACLKAGLRIPEDLSVSAYEGKYASQLGIYQITSAGPELEPILRELLKRLANRHRTEFTDLFFEMKLIEGNTVRNIAE